MTNLRQEAPDINNVGPGGAPAESPHRHDMIQPPPRGDLRAVIWIVAGAVVYIALVAVFLIALAGEQGFLNQFAEFFGLGETKNWSLFTLVGGGIVLTIVATVTVLHDLRQIRKEEDDIEWIHRRGRPGALLVLMPPAEREALFARGERTIPTGALARVETLLDDRVRRAREATLRGAGVSVPVEELRIIAERRTARWGSFARYASSLLLLLAVLGTFVGVKTALPELIDAVAETGATSPLTASGAVGTSPNQTGPGAPLGQTSNLTRSLQAVSDAFGANALALIGSIAVGLMAQGLGVGRRHMLERLELVSAEYIYGENESPTADPLRAAVQALRQAAYEIQNSSGALLGIEGGLEALGDEFKSAIGSLDDRLTQLVHHQESGLYERTSGVLEELEMRVGTLATVVDANTRLYGSLVDRIGERTSESTEAIKQLHTANSHLAKALEGTIRLGDASARASQTVEESTQALAKHTLEVSRQMEAINRSVSELRPLVSDVRSVLDDATTRIQRIDERSTAAWAEVGAQVTRKLEQLAVVVTEPASGNPALSRETESILRQIAANTAARGGRRMPAWQLALLPMLGVVIGAGVLYLITWLGLP